jgi:archaemetzincin
VRRDQPPRPFAVALLLDPCLVSNGAALADEWHPVQGPAGAGALDAEQLARAAAPRRRRGRPLLVLTHRPLRLSGCHSIIGFADRRHSVVVISTLRLIDADSSAAFRRLHNVIAHELGHLDGLKHCPAAACVMHPVRDAADLDRRPFVTCGRCPRTWTAAFLRRVQSICSGSPAPPPAPRIWKEGC